MAKGITCFWHKTPNLSLATGVWQPRLRLLLRLGRHSFPSEKSLALGQDRPDPGLPLSSLQELSANKFLSWLGSAFLAEK